MLLHSIDQQPERVTGLNLRQRVLGCQLIGTELSIAGFITGPEQPAASLVGRAVAAVSFSDLAQQEALIQIGGDPRKADPLLAQLLRQGSVRAIQCSEPSLAY